MFHKSSFRIVVILGALLAGNSSAQTASVDTLEDIGPDGTPVTTRNIGGVTVTISTGSERSLEARTYFDGSPNAFGGAGLGANAPLNPGNVSLSRFISTVDRAFRPNGCFPQVAPIIFEFSTPLKGFGLTTVDLLEGNGSLTLRAYDDGNNAVAEQTRSGPQGTSGLDLDWLVSTATANIVRAELLGSIDCSVGGYGIDDLIVEPEVAMIVSIDIKPGSEPNCFNVNGHGVIPVAVLGSDSFDVTDVDITTLSFGGLAVRMRGNKGSICGYEDSNNDGIQDLVCHFEDDPSAWNAGSDSATLSGLLLDGSPFEGSDSICVVP